MNFELSKDSEGRNTVMKLRYFDGAMGVMIKRPNYTDWTIDEKIKIRAFYASPLPHMRQPNNIIKHYHKPTHQ